MGMTNDELQYVFNHLFLPPKLPHQDDYGAERELALVSTAIDGLVSWKVYVDSSRREQVDAAISMLHNTREAHSATDGSLYVALPLLVREQNAGVLISKHNDRIFIEVFEVSPSNEATMTAKGRLRRSFPGAAVVLNESDFRQRGLRETIAHTLSGMSKQVVEALQPKAKKAGDILPEDRDTNHPGMISELFIGFLRSIGEAVDCPIVVKNMRDDVLWNDARSPWRRSPLWLLIRVSLRLAFTRKTPAESSAIYKEAMLFILCQTLRLATNQGFESEMLYSMNAKLTRRLLKIGPAINDRVISHVQKAMEDTRNTIAQRWSKIQKQDAREMNLSYLSKLDFVTDTCISLPELDNYISWMGSRQQEHSSDSFQPSSNVMVFPRDILPQLPPSLPDKTTAIANLEAFETWVALHCRRWSQDNPSISCNELSSLIVTYHQLALPYYLKNPVALSAMLLTIFELWIACDAAAVNLCPLLGRYDPGVPWHILENLLLPFASQMQKLCDIEKYLNDRSTSSRFPYSQLYYHLEDCNSFPVKFFDRSEEMQETHDKIVTSAEEKKRAKLTELHTLEAEYNRLMTLSGEMECEYKDVLVDIFKNHYKQDHSSSCQKCRYETQARNLEIDLHEWPLPRSSTKAKAVIFELRIPPFLQSWRQTTFYLLLDVIEMQYSDNPPKSSDTYCLDSDPHLPHKRSISSRIGLSSQYKPQVCTHRSAQKVSTATDSSVCVNNGLDYKYFDFETRQFVESFSPTEKVLEMCTYHLPTRSKGLRKYLLRPATSPDGPSPNTAIADQSEAPIHMSVEEARDLALLPLGHHLQLYNILVQLASPSLDFRKEETAVFIYQCLYQVGPSGNTLRRVSHAIAESDEFAACLIENVSMAWQRVRENWGSSQALSVFMAITTRLLSLAVSVQVRQSCFKLLCTLRVGALAWVELLRDKSHNSTTEDDRAYFKLKSVDVALICASSFDVEDGHLSHILNSGFDASIFVQCSILVQEGQRDYDPASELSLACLSLRFQRLLYRSSSILSATLSGVSDAVSKSWAGFRSGTEWRVACNTTHWLVTETTSDDQGTRLQVHYDLLSGELLVNGIPLSRPPRKYEDHPLWQTFFGRTAAEVMPTLATGMQFSTKRQHEGYDIHLGLNSTSSGSSDLLVQASNATDQYETIPNRLLQGKFPEHFTRSFVHWYSHRNDTLEFRAVETPWTKGDSTWILSRLDRGWVLWRKDINIVGAETRTATTIAHVLFPLAERTDIHISVQPSGGSPLEVEIPALRLGFFLCPGESILRSREFRGMSVDGDQSLGTLIGFSNKLVLKGDLTDGHANVAVGKASITQVHPLYVDRMLGRLTDNESLQGKLFLSYLHALTSYYLPDPLTSRTGVEQALWILTSAAVRSFDRLSQQNVNTLVDIARLNPTRHYYPQHERVMQTVSWVSNLNYLSQHDGFYTSVGAIFEHARQMSLFFAGSDSGQIDTCQLDITAHIRTNEFLMERNRIRLSTFRIPGCGAEAHTTAHDVTYSSRDRDQESFRGKNAYVLSSMLYHGLTTLHIEGTQGGELWRIMSATPEVFSADEALTTSHFRFSVAVAKRGLDLSRWLMLHRFLSTQSSASNKFRVMIWLSTVASHEEANMALLQILALFCTADKLKNVRLPSIESCHPPKGYEATDKLLRAIVDHGIVPFDFSPEARLRLDPGENWRVFQSRRQRQYAANLSSAVEALVAQLHRQWPRESLQTLDSRAANISNYVTLATIEPDLRRQFKEWFANRCFFEYLERLERTLSQLDHHPLMFYQPGPVKLKPPTRARAFVSVRDLFAGQAPVLPTALQPQHISTSRLASLLDVLVRTSTASYEASYIRELQTSMLSLQQREGVPSSDVCTGASIASLRQHLDDCKRNVDDIFFRLVAACAVQDRFYEIGHGLRLSPMLLLGQLRNGAWKSLSPEWRACLIRYGLALSGFQRAERLVRAADSQSKDDLVRELGNIGHLTWDPLEHPEWLLMEVESNIIIRDVQERVASEMLDPSSHCNAVMQLNMGEGKSSVIVPMLAADLANGSQLARVVVAKPQSKQMLQMLISKLGGLLARRIYHMPFSRALVIDSTAITDTIYKMMSECHDGGGVLLVQPEHLLSFQLMGLECYCQTETAKQAIGRSLIHIQDFFDNKSRDIVDESDENFSPKFELVYTMGSQRPIELSPTRWICIQHILSCVRSIASELADRLPDSVECSRRNDGGFPRFRILNKDAGRRLVEGVAQMICRQGMDGFPITSQPRHIRDAVFKYVTQYDLSPEEINAVEQTDSGGFYTETTKPLLLLLRGILAGGVLDFALSQRRWRVNFGLTTARKPPTKLAVPYRAKDSPTPRSEFSHPDVVIVLTCLAYYYGGLEDDDLFMAFGHLLDSDQADPEYSAWMEDCPDIPHSFRQLEGINLKDRPQCIKDVFPRLRYGKSTVDYFLCHIVFPKEIKEFPSKLSSSGWDIGKTKAHYTTGFSGTKDSRKLLPLDMKHLDLPSQTPTNALVLEYLLQPENSVIPLPDVPSAAVTDAERFLTTVVDLEPPTRVILDVGAQILELNNEQVAESWLRMVTGTEVQAAVFVNDEDELCVVDRHGRLELLQTSSYAARLDSCLVFLDEAHTRGIDLKLPTNYRAAVTLGANLTKDRLIQACMRLRKLGKGQSVVFCVNAEIRAKIQALPGKLTGAAITVMDVLQWAITETFADIKRSMPLWAAQGDRFLRQDELWKEVQIDGATFMSRTHAEKFLEDEARSLETRYAPRPEEDVSVADRLRSRSQRSIRIVERCNEFEHLQVGSSSLQEEQERELSPEVEQERQVQRPAPAQPLVHSLHPDVSEFVDTGGLSTSSPAYMRAFDALNDTSAAQDFMPSQLSSGDLFVTTDFARTVEKSDNGHVSDSFQRPVQWILSRRPNDGHLIDVIMIISPYEAEKLMPRLQRKSAKAARVTLHLYKARYNTAHRRFDHLDFLTILAPGPELEVPRSLYTQLNIFAGQLYFDTYEDYLEACKFLGLASDVAGEGEVVEPDGYILRDSNGMSRFQKSPVGFLGILMSKVRRNGQGISKTHVGIMLDGKLLRQEGRGIK
ncbi:hypothetical protein GGR54DRAFT_630279 [Hypoxylon sp. NC1633]|nr:hypothetical protein GGR54DRAFT_630279 [Hypoxylon sp. NC1633]